MHSYHKIDSVSLYTNIKYAAHKVHETNLMKKACPENYRSSYLYSKYACAAPNVHKNLYIYHVPSDAKYIKLHGHNTVFI